MNLRTATPPRVAQRSAACCSGGRVHPQMILLLVVLKVCFFLANCGPLSGLRETRYSCTHPLVFRRPRTTKPDRPVTNSAETMRRIDRQPLREWKHRELIDEPHRP